ncbi:hypothetical protein SK128_024049 [Halocaridina rubra]|uniref:EF-hand domain-containing protein n=1 Tax=Halocaridina rubra TaxID=373956 RepID=A0AAN9A4Q9_HALRR
MNDKEAWRFMVAHVRVDTALRVPDGMDRECSNGVGGSKGLVAGVKAAFRPRSRSKPNSKALKEEEIEKITSKLNSESSYMPLKSNRSPKSPFMGWKRSKSKDKSRKDSTRSKEDKTNNKYHPPTGFCSESQAERLSSHISDDYPSYSSDASEMMRDIRTGRYTSFLNHNESHERTNCKTTSPTFEATNIVPTENYGCSSPLYGKDMDYYSADSRYVNLPTNCFGRSCVRYSKNSEKSFILSTERCFERNETYGYGHGGDMYSQDYQQNIENKTSREIYMTNSLSDEKPHDGMHYSKGKDTSLFPWSGLSNAYQGTILTNEGQESNEESSYAVRVSGDGSEAQDLITTEIKVQEEIKVGSPSPTLGKRQSWLKSALTYNLEVPDFPKNEVVVLALGIDQYIEEVFRYLDHSGTGKIYIEDFRALCNVLGLGNKQEEDDKKRPKRCQCMGSNLTLLGSLNNSLNHDNSVRDHGCPVHLTFAEFHDKLCESFVRGAKTESIIPLASRRLNNPRLVTSVIQVQRRYDVLENIAKCLDEVSAGLDADEDKMIAECPASRVVCCKCQQSAHIDKNSNIAMQPTDSETSFLQKQILLQQQELQCLREVIEDMRIALQSSDAENLALQVKTLRSGGPSQQSSTHDLSLTDEEDTIDDLVNQLKALSRPDQIGDIKPVLEPNITDSIAAMEGNSKLDGPETSEDPLNTAFFSGDYSLEKELHATYEALQAAREEREATQADLQRVVGELQECEKDLQGAELSLRAAHTALEKVHYDNQALVLELAETRGNLEETRKKLLETTESLQFARESILEKERQLKEAHTKLNLIRNSR